MHYEEFRKKTRGMPIIRSNLFSSLTNNVQQLRVQVNQWVKKGYVQKLKRGVYKLRDIDSEKKSSNYFLSNLIYAPSYVGLETAMQYYHFIPEAVRSYTSVTTKKTNYFSNDLGDFYYHNVKKEIFIDFQEKLDSYGNKFLISSPEKTLLDFIYLKASHHKVITKGLLDEGYRLQNLENLDLEKLKVLSKVYNSKKMTEAANALIELVLEEWRDD